MAKLGLRIKGIVKFLFNTIEVKGDGNCLFRSISDQIEGNDINHQFYRKAAVNLGFIYNLCFFQ